MAEGQQPPADAPAGRPLAAARTPMAWQERAPAGGADVPPGGWGLFDAADHLARHPRRRTMTTGSASGKIARVSTLSAEPVAGSSPPPLAAWPATGGLWVWAASSLTLVGATRGVPALGRDRRRGGDLDPLPDVQLWHAGAAGRGLSDLAAARRPGADRAAALAMGSNPDGRCGPGREDRPGRLSSGRRAARLHCAAASRDAHAARAGRLPPAGLSHSSTSIWQCPWAPA